MAGRRAKRDEYGRAPQHFSLSSAARSFSPKDISRLTDDQAYELFVAFRFESTGGKPVCPHCGFDVCYRYESRRVFKCKQCERQFSVTTNTDFADRKLSFRKLLELIVEFALEAKGQSAIQGSKFNNISHKAVWLNFHKFRAAMRRSLEGTVFDQPVEIDGAAFGGHIRPKNIKKERTDRRKIKGRSNKRQIVGVIRENVKGIGRTRIVIAPTEAAAACLMVKFIKPGTLIYADEGDAFNFLGARHPMKRVKHETEYWTPEASTNNAECYFSMLRRSAFGVYHKISGQYLASYAFEMCWRQDHRRKDTKSVFSILGGLVASAEPSEWKGYYQRRKAAA